MSTLKDGKKWKGRFIRKNDPILDNLTILNFDFEKIAITPTVMPDNIHNSIIHERLHLKKSINRALKPPAMSTLEFNPEGGRIPIIAPIDFTKDWQRMRARSSRRNSRFDDDDDDFEHEVVNIALGKDNAQKGDPPKEDSKDPNSESETETEIGTGTEAANTDAEKQEDSSKDSTGEMEALDEAARNLPKSDEVYDNPLVVHPQPAETSSSNSETSTESHQNSIDENALQEAFDQGVREAQSHFENEKLQLQTELEKESEKINSLLGELTGLKKDILSKAQGNFEQICQSIISSILKQEFQLNPDIFSKLIQSAIDQASPEGDFKIIVNPKSADDLKKHIDPNLSDLIVTSEELPEGNFQIESQSGLVDGNWENLITEMLENSDYKLNKPVA